MGLGRKEEKTMEKMRIKLPKYFEKSFIIIVLNVGKPLQI